MERTRNGLVAGSVFVTAGLLAAPICIRVVFQPCDSPENCGTGSPVTICEDSWSTEPGGPYRIKQYSNWVMEKQKCFTFPETALGDCNTDYPGYKKIPNCRTQNTLLCCYVPVGANPQVSDGPLTILRPEDIEKCVGTGAPAYPF
ncbi:MAG: hypothetical protein HRU70_07700 [Phycisphaeraceae bacterium]|nr:MAG: hypothetical protein HRU70_07700 [Phycisphaeraceae bacterium]